MLESRIFSETLSFRAVGNGLREIVKSTPLFPGYFSAEVRSAQGEEIPTENYMDFFPSLFSSTVDVFHFALFTMSKSSPRSSLLPVLSPIAHRRDAPPPARTSGRPRGGRERGGCSERHSTALPPRGARRTASTDQGKRHFGAVRCRSSSEPASFSE